MNPASAGSERTTSSASRRTASQIGSTAATPARWARCDVRAMATSHRLVGPGPPMPVQVVGHEVQVNVWQAPAGAYRRLYRRYNNTGLRPEQMSALPSFSTAFALGLDLAHRRGQKFGHGSPQLRIGHGDALGVEVCADLLENVLIALGGKVCFAHRLDVVVNCGTLYSELAGGPLGQEPVAALLGPELELLVERKLLLERPFAFLEAGHSTSPIGSHRSRTVPFGPWLYSRLPGYGPARYPRIYAESTNWRFGLAAKRCHIVSGLPFR